MGNSFQREDVDFYSKGTRCSAWLYLPASDKKCPIIVMAHGLGGTREMRLYEYAERFAEAGYACFLFDYRNFGASDGNKRQLINVKMQLEDWNNAIEYVKKDNRIDGENLLLFGTSFSGGHVIWLSAHRNDIKATVAQCPYTDTMATVKMVSLPYILKKVPFVIADLLSCIRGYHPVMLKLSTYKGENAFMEADEETTKRFIGDAEFRMKHQQEHYLNLSSILPANISVKSTIRFMLRFVQKIHWLLQKKPYNLQETRNTQLVNSMIADTLIFI
ncbi:alpha/beta hydrolase [Thermoactinomyces sp. CICC 10735]|uniref:alpha/beta hydrolase n=1 Tax=Thermoactinomyces TaxID=2023 RepID=UPI001E557183|nr:alpha/beta fold hydrolase [Thermoactinomyces sp. CICC 10735]